MKTPSVDALTNSALMALAKEYKKAGIDIFGLNRNDMFRKMLRAMNETVLSEHVAQTTNFSVQA